jgi:hypothetical protein
MWMAYCMSNGPDWLEWNARSLPDRLGKLAKTANFGEDEWVRTTSLLLVDAPRRHDLPGTDDVAEDSALT